MKSLPMNNLMYANKKNEEKTEKSNPSLTCVLQTQHYAGFLPPCQQRQEPTIKEQKENANILRLRGFFLI
jgi:hypothetical protein